MADPLEFLDIQSMSEDERNALNLARGVSNPTLQAETTVVEPPAAVEPAPETLVDGSEPAEGHRVPLATYLSTRDELKDTKAKLAEFEAKQNAVSNAIEFNLPDPVKDPAGYSQATAAIGRLELLNERMNYSEKFARFAFKDEGTLVDDAKAWALGRFENDPSYEESIMQDADPYDKVVKDYRASQQVATLQTDEWSQFQAWKAAQAGATVDQKATPAASVAQPVAPVATQQQPASRAPVPRSITDLPSAGGSTHAVTAGPGQAFDNVFTR